jgi:TRAP-type C4-dicarboxylate transport system substrate-binding protein
MNRRELLGTGAVAAMLAAPYVARGASPLTLRFAHFAQDDHPANIAAKQFAERVAERTGNTIRVMILPNNQLGGPPEQAQQIKLGTIDMGLPTHGQLDKYDKAFGAVMLPFIFDSRPLVFRVLDGPAMDWLAPLAETQGFILLRNWDYGFRNVTSGQSMRPTTSRASSFARRPNCRSRLRWRPSARSSKRSLSPSFIWRWRRRSWTGRKIRSP